MYFESNYSTHIKRQNKEKHSHNACIVAVHSSFLNENKNNIFSTNKILSLMIMFYTVV